MEKPKFENAIEKVLDLSVELGEVDIKDSKGNSILSNPINAKKKVIESIQVTNGKIGG